MAEPIVSVGDYFEDFVAFKTVINQRAEQLNEKLVIGHSSHTVEERNKALKGSFRFKPELVYTSVVFRCVHEGTFNSKGSKRQSSSLKNGCPVIIKLRADRFTNRLQVVTAELVHSHVLPQKKDGAFCSDRKLADGEKEEVQKLLDLDAPVRKIQNFVASSIGKPVKVKDLHNLRQTTNETRANGRTIEEQVWAVLTDMVKQDAGAHYSVFEEEDMIKTVFIQTSHMKRLLQSYPDVLYIDTTYCLNTFSYPVVVFMVVDGDNDGQCVEYACVKDERLVTLSVLFGEFVRRNEGVCVKTVIVNKDASEIAAVRKTMPECDIVLCRFHVAKSLYDAVRKYCPKVEQDRMYGLCTKMLRCASEDVFWESLNEVPDGVFKAYLDKNWIPVRHNGANFSTKTMVTWGNKTNNFVERHNRALKTVTNSKTSLAQFFESLLIFHRQQDHRLKQKVQELALRSVVLRPEVTRAAAVLSEAHRVLTPYACEQIKLQYNKLKDVMCSYDSDAKVLLVRKSDMEVMEHFVGEGCQCLHFVERGLSCWHMLAMYESQGVNVVETVPERYKLKRMIECVMHETTYESETGVCAATGRVSVVGRNTEMAEWQKRLKMKEVCRELVSVGSRCGQDMFERRLGVLRGLIKRWRGGGGR